MISITDIEKPSNDTMKFVVKGCNSSFVNAIRRIILSEVETVGFNIDDYENSDLKIMKNSSSSHNEFLLHRLGLIPINVAQVSDFNPDKVIIAVSTPELFVIVTSMSSRLKNGKSIGKGVTPAVLPLELISCCIRASLSAIDIVAMITLYPLRTPIC